MSEVEAFLEEHPEFRADLNLRRADNGETISPQRSDWLGESDSRRYTAYGGLGDISALERGEEELVPVWPSGSRTWAQRQMDARVEKALALVKPKYRDLIERVYFQRQTQDEIAREFRISQQAVSQRVKTALAAVTQVIAKHGQEWNEIDESDI